MKLTLDRKVALVESSLAEELDCAFGVMVRRKIWDNSPKPYSSNEVGYLTNTQNLENT
jgi:hypothetical protein